ncbi:phenylalanine biosynthesis protein PheB [Gottschalkia acidurici 9a]|uniref:UPF0735 ACT domain-containing protein Curi_c00710 n=1 Tax=Gottschalkia acidurici (strain ATCC 7906 / DSM 604 / BCRC 14475 / CIP 104303 / KCTC 5404 / NCIMB 10678 / 9a) TaxID=1128398 RepID=K0AWK9_GOTA9|nr:ACT domain-containing protein [Gottschalkia acidurici]AFS77152.1 phenylalanine biosynthesis protein PheB [Gottschalkia acidurici 9a]
MYSIESKYLVIDKDILPDVFEKVLLAKELLRTGEVKEITEAVKKVGISRSTFYKYKDSVFTLDERSMGKKVTLSFLLSHMQGVLSNVLQTISANGGNVLTINQDIPIHDVANVSITFDVSHIKISIEEVIEEVKSIEGVQKLVVVTME